MGKIGVTCRQPFLGAFEWIEEDVAKAQKAEPKRLKPRKKSPPRREKSEFL